jgi:hypothetical protein
MGRTNKLAIAPTVAMTCMGDRATINRGLVPRSVPSMLVLITIGMLTAYADGSFHPTAGAAAVANSETDVDTGGSMAATDRQRLGRRLAAIPIVDVATFEELSDAIDSNVTG